MNQPGAATLGTLLTTPQAATRVVHLRRPTWSKAATQSGCHMFTGKSKVKTNIGSENTSTGVTADSMGWEEVGVPRQGTVPISTKTWAMQVRSFVKSHKCTLNTCTFHSMQIFLQDKKFH